MDNFFQLAPASRALGRRGSAPVGTRRVPSRQLPSFRAPDFPSLSSLIHSTPFSPPSAKRTVRRPSDGLCLHQQTPDKNPQAVSFKGFGFGSVLSSSFSALSSLEPRGSRNVTEGSWPPAHDPAGPAKRSARPAARETRRLHGRQTPPDFPARCVISELINISSPVLCYYSPYVLIHFLHRGKRKISLFS